MRYINVRYLPTYLHTYLVVNYTEATVEWEQWAVEDFDSDTGEDSEAAGDSKNCNRLLVIMLNC